MLGIDLHGWETVMVYSLGIAAVAAIAIVISTKVVILLQRESLKESEDALEEYKTDAGLKIAVAGEGTAKALEKAATLEKEAEFLRTEGDKARAELGKTNERMTELDLKLTKQRELTAKAEEARLALEQRVLPRRISETQRTSLINALKREPVKGLIQINCVLGDAEGFMLARQFEEILKAAEWPTPGVSQSIYNTLPVGVVFEIGSAIAPPLHAEPIRRAFHSAGLDLEGKVSGDTPVGSVRLLVGVKP